MHNWERRTDSGVHRRQMGRPQRSRRRLAQVKCKYNCSGDGTLVHSDKWKINSVLKLRVEVTMAYKHDLSGQTAISTRWLNFAASGICKTTFTVLLWWPSYHESPIAQW